MKKFTELELLEWIETADELSTSHEQAEEVGELKELAALIAEVGDSSTKPDADKRIATLIRSKPIGTRGLKSKAVFIVAAAAILLLLLNLVLTPNNPTTAYNKLQSNPEKLNFIRDMQLSGLNKEQYSWLEEQLITEQNPNIRVAIIDIISTSNYQPQELVFDQLADEEVPVVQMALLALAESSAASGAKEGLKTFAIRTDLEPLVKQRLDKLLSEIN